MVGAWACLDEFNRMDMAVLSVAFSQLKAILDALRHGKDICVFDGHEVPPPPLEIRRGNACRMTGVLCARKARNLSKQSGLPSV